MSSSNVDDRTGKPVVCRETKHEHSQANPKIPKTNQKETTIERRSPLFADSCWAPSDSEIPEWLPEFTENLVDDAVPEHRDSHASSFHEVSLQPTSTMLKLTSPKTEIARSARGPKLQGPRAEDALAELYLVLKFWWLDNSRPQGPKRQLRVSKQSSIRSRGAGSGHPMDPGVSVQNKNFSGNPEKLAKVPGTREES